MASVGGARTHLTPGMEAELVDSMHPPFNRSHAIASMGEFCHLPYDAAHPAAETREPIADWGKVTKVESVVAMLGDRKMPLVVYTVEGQRRTYRLNDDYGALGYVDPKVGQWITLCHEDDDDVYQLGLSRSHQVVPGSGPPRVTEFAKLAPIHTTAIKLMIQGQQGKLTIAADRRYLVDARIDTIENTNDGSRANLRGWSIEIPSGMTGASALRAGTSAWFIVENPAFEPQPTGSPRLVFRAAAVIDQLFP